MFYLCNNNYLIRFKFRVPVILTGNYNNLVRPVNINSKLAISILL